MEARELAQGPETHEGGVRPDLTEVIENPLKRQERPGPESEDPWRGTPSKPVRPDTRRWIGGDIA